VTRYSIGVDFGTLSGRGVLVDVETGEIAATSVLGYSHGVMSDRLRSGIALPHDWALQHPRDYLEVLDVVIHDMLRTASADPASVIALSIDFTACTMLPLSDADVPLCFLDEFADNPHAYVKLWKHHSAQDLANRITEHAQRRNEPWLTRYGDRVSSEWMFPKIWQTLREAPEVYESAAEFIEAGDWVIRYLTGARGRSSALAGYKALWSAQDGMPGDDFWRGLDEGLVGVEGKLPGPYLDAGSLAGRLNEAGAELTGLSVGTAVAVANSDAYACAPAVGVTGPGTVVAIVGTSVCTLVMDPELHSVPGVSGAIDNGILPGYVGYEAGQAAVGDMLAWCVNEAVPASYTEEAARIGVDIHAYLQALAADYAPGGSGLIALDWWNGNRSVLVDGELSGTVVGYTLGTTAVDLYHALLESAAFGMRVVVDTLVDRGVMVNDLVITGGISRKSPMLMQMYADVLGRTVRASLTPYGAALGAAIFGTVAAGDGGGGYDSIEDAVEAMASTDEQVYEPRAQAQEAYEKLYREFVTLHDYFGRGGNDVMRRLRCVGITEPTVAPLPK